MSYADVQYDPIRMTGDDPKQRVFIIHGRNQLALAAMEQFLRVLRLQPFNFDELAADQGGTATIGQIVRAGLERANGIIALFTPDEEAILRPDFKNETDSDADSRRWQARQNVIFEAGMAYGMAQKRTIIVTLGPVSLFSDIAGIHVVHLDNSADRRSRLRQKLIGVQCAVDLRTDEWRSVTKAGDFEGCVKIPVVVPDHHSTNEKNGTPETEETAKQRIYTQNELVIIPGRKISIGLSPHEIDYIVEFLVQNHFNVDPSREGLKALRHNLSINWPQKQPSHAAPFRLSRYPVTIDQFAMFADSTKYVTTAERMRQKQHWRKTRNTASGDHPATYLSYTDSVAFCDWLGVRLPTEEEYEKAVRGSEQRLFPWGNTWEPNRCNDILWVEHISTSPVDFFKESVSTDGIYDLTGNIFEWVISPATQRGVQRLVGGAFDKSAVWRGNAAAHAEAPIHYVARNCGFRFASDIK